MFMEKRIQKHSLIVILSIKYSGKVLVYVFLLRRRGFGVSSHLYWNSHGQSNGLVTKTCFLRYAAKKFFGANNNWILLENNEPKYCIQL